ncbi:MAG: SPFH domain-containing protein [Solirubrobacteraceae bacterium]|nr:SPFH domain-containing protein [Patulibacter sp.]
MPDSVNPPTGDADDDDPLSMRLNAPLNPRPDAPSGRALFGRRKAKAESGGGSGGSGSGRPPGRGGLGPFAVFGGVLGTVIGAFAFLALAYGVIGALDSYKATDPGEVCVVIQGGLFDGKSITQVRQPGEGRKFIGAYNKQVCLPTTDRDTSSLLDDDQTEFPTRDGVQVVVDGQGLFQLTSDPALVKSFYNTYGRRNWNGQPISSEAGLNAFFRTRLAPAVADATREVIGGYDCIQLNNLCQYITSPDDAVKGQTKKVETSQNLSTASNQLAKEIDVRLKAAFNGKDYFENIRYQNLRIRFQPKVNEQIQDAQATRTATANAKLKAEQDRQTAIGSANVAIAKARGARSAAFAQAKAYKLNPNQAVIDRIKAFCGPDGCNPQVLGGSLKDVIANLGK